LARVVGRHDVRCARADHQPRGLDVRGGEEGHAESAVFCGRLDELADDVFCLECLGQDDAQGREGLDECRLLWGKMQREVTRLCEEIARVVRSVQRIFARERGGSGVEVADERRFRARSGDGHGLGVEGEQEGLVAPVVCRGVDEQVDAAVGERRASRGCGRVGDELEGEAVFRAEILEGRRDIGAVFERADARAVERPEILRGEAILARAAVKNDEVAQREWLRGDEGICRVDVRLDGQHEVDLTREELFHGRVRSHGDGREVPVRIFGKLGQVGDLLLCDDRGELRRDVRLDAADADGGVRILRPGRCRRGGGQQDGE